MVLLWCPTNIHDVATNLASFCIILPYEAKRQYLLTLQVNRYCLLALQSSIRPFSTYSTDFTKWDRFFISGWPALTLASPSLARAQARRDRRRIGCAQRMKWARAPTRFGPGKYTRPNPTWACTQYTVWRLTWMLWTMCHLAGLARLALGKTGRPQLDHIQHHRNSSELI